MFKMKYNLFLIILLLINPIMCFSMNSYFSIWINMELNLILFLTFIIMNNLNLYDLSMKYFLINSMSSSIFLFFVIMNFMNLSMFSNLLMNFMIFIKLGMPPFHFWYIDLMKNLNWISCLILSSWQKLIPMLIMFYIFNENFFMIILIISMIISIFKAFISINLKIIFAYSSINHLCWMMMLLIYSLNLWMVYYISYLIMNFSIFFIFNKMNFIYLNDLNKMIFFFNSKFNFMMLISLGGIPPLFGFLIKWLSILEMSFLSNYFILMIMIFFSLIFLYYYIRLLFNNMFLFNDNLKYNFLMLIYKKNFLINLIFLFIFNYKFIYSNFLFKLNKKF
uniref:NADH-ubiquinone oxidoreductase chain 2 n=1 Tax=Cotesia vestalis TaxID=217443 RepID=D8KZD4_COTVE|nr:NADH dehydrogenase subunit 2 [Cotesia vestalis]ACH71086.1 NADH dehydrogenase subunit 2 [Cotesia vestalis]